MATTRKLISAILTIVMIFGVASMLGDSTDVIGIKAEAADYDVGDIIEFGLYPQSEVTDSALKSKLNSQSLSWKSYGYYYGDGGNFGSSKPADTMKYTDIIYNGEKYRGVKFSEYRAAYITAASGYGGTPQATNGYKTDVVYWFKYEPLEWRVLDPDKGFLLCESLVDSQSFVNTPYWKDNNGDGDFNSNEIYGDAGCTYLHYDYPHSSINEWLNSTFYNTAFSEGEKKKISDNTFVYPDNLLGIAPSPSIARETVSEKVSLLSVEDVMSSDYGFDSTVDSTVKDDARVGYGTDYALCQGLLCENGASYWFLRSSWESDNRNGGVFAVDPDGSIGHSAPAQFTGIGIRPAIVLSFNTDTYDFGEETYSFDNYSDDNSDGHCFGMSMTSAGYHIGELDITTIGGNKEDDLYALKSTNSVKKPICYYQRIQGYYLKSTIVAGGTNYKNKNNWNMASDWNAVVNYVSDHDYDNEGTLQIGLRKKGETGGHAVNFLRYEEVNGQARIYVYDNNFPETETYFYMNSKGNVMQYPKSTFNGSVDCIALRSVPKYFSLVDDYDSTRYIYAKKDTIAIEGVEDYLLDGATETGKNVVFEVPSDARKITIIPLVDNAEFEYLDKDYNFGVINDDTEGRLTLISADDAAAGDTEAEFTVINGGNGSANTKTTLEIRKPSTTTVSYGDSMILHADAESIPNGGYIEWTASNGNFTYSESADGTTCTVSPSSSGDTTFTATVYDANGKEICKDEQTMTSKAGFFQKIIAFFKKLFGATKVIPEAMDFISKK